MKNVLFYIPFLFFCLFGPEIPAQDTIQLLNRGRFPDGSELNQSSGLALAPDGNFWTHNDQGMSTMKLYRFVPNVGSESVDIIDTVDINVPNIDWEDVTRDGFDKLYLCDIGRNCNANSPPGCHTRFVFKIYEFNYDDLLNGAEPLTPTTYFFKYEQVAGCGPLDTVFANTEAAVYYQNAIYFFTKDLWSRPTNNCGSWAASNTHRFKVSLIPGSTESTPLIAEYLDGFNVEVIPGEEYGHRKILSGSISPNGQKIALSSARRLWLLSGFTGDNWLDGSVEYFDYEDSNGTPISRGYEGLEFTDDNTIFLSVDGNAGRINEVDITGLTAPPPPGKVGIGTTNPLTPLHLKNGDVYVDQPGAGVIFRSPDGTCYKLTIADGGTMQAVEVDCPE